MSLLVPSFFLILLHLRNQRLFVEEQALHVGTQTSVHVSVIDVMEIHHCTPEAHISLSTSDALFAVTQSAALLRPCPLSSVKNCSPARIRDSPVHVIRRVKCFVHRDLDWCDIVSAMIRSSLSTSCRLEGEVGTDEGFVKTKSDFATVHGLGPDGPNASRWYGRLCVQKSAFVALNYVKFPGQSSHVWHFLDRIATSH